MPRSSTPRWQTPLAGWLLVLAVACSESTAQHRAPGVDGGGAAGFGVDSGSAGRDGGGTTAGAGAAGVASGGAAARGGAGGAATGGGGAQGGATAGIGGGGGTPDAGHDSSVGGADSGVDAQAPIDAAFEAEVSVDASPEVDAPAAEAASDAPIDAVTDAVSDATTTVDGASDAVTDAVSGVDAAPDAPADTGTDAVPTADATADAPADGVDDASPDASGDAPADAPPDVAPACLLPPGDPSGCVCEDLDGPEGPALNVSLECFCSIHSCPCTPADATRSAMCPPFQGGGGYAEYGPPCHLTVVSLEVNYDLIAYYWDSRTGELLRIEHASDAGTQCPFDATMRDAWVVAGDPKPPRLGHCPLIHSCSACQGTCP